MTASDTFTAALAACPLIAIMRGLRPDEAEAIGTVLLDAGFRMIEVPLNSPDPFASITRLSALAGNRALVGAGTVLDVEAVSRVRACGGRLVVSPGTDRAVIEATVAAGMVALPGCFTPATMPVWRAAGADGFGLGAALFRPGMSAAEVGDNARRFVAALA